MKKHVIFWMAIGLGACQAPSAQESAEAEEKTVHFASYGAPIEADAAKEVSMLPKLMGEQDSAQLKLTGEIEQTCAVSGCWMTIKNELGESLRVTFKDYGFFVPTSGQEGKKAVFEGVVRRKKVTVEEQKHLAQDAGKTAEEIAAISEPMEALSFEANGVLIESEEMLN